MERVKRGRGQRGSLPRLYTTQGQRNLMGSIVTNAVLGGSDLETDKTSEEGSCNCTRITSIKRESGHRSEHEGGARSRN